MNQEVVSKLEREIEAAVATVFSRLGQRHLPLLPSDQTLHLIAKAAVTAYEVAVENQIEHHD